MPPEDEDQLSNDAKTDFLDELANVMVAQATERSDQLGHAAAMNRREYQNTLRELLGVEMPVGELPADIGSGNFDTVGANLFMSVNQFEQYLTLGRRVLDLAFERELMADEERYWRYETEAISQKVAKHVEWQIDAKDRAERWVAAVEAVAAEPKNAQIVAKLREQVNNHEDNFRRLWAQIRERLRRSPLDSKPLRITRIKLTQPVALTGCRTINTTWSSLTSLPGMYLAIPTEHPSILENGAITWAVGWSAKTGANGLPATM